MTAGLPSLPEGYRAAVFGASGGVGNAFVKALSADPRCAQVHAGARSVGSRLSGPKIVPFTFNLEDEPSIAGTAESIRTSGPVHLVVVATGILHEAGLQPEKSWRSLSPDTLARLYAVNTIGPALIAKHMLPGLPSSGRSIFAALSAKVGSISDNRLGGWHSYRASKAALNMLIRSFAIELARSRPAAVCVALHPGTVDTALSAPFQGGVPNLLSPDVSAEHLLRVLDGLTPDQSGRLFGWDGAEIPP